MTQRLFFAHLLFLLSPQQGVSPSEQVLEACTEVAEILSPAWGLERSNVLVEDDRTGQTGSGCRVRVVTTTTSFENGDSPDVRLRARLPATGWTEDFGYAADGSDGTAFALRKDAVLCQIRAMWDGGDDSDPTYVPDPRYELVTHCMEGPRLPPQGPSTTHRNSLAPCEPNDRFENSPGRRAAWAKGISALDVGRSIAGRSAGGDRDHPRNA